ncbi:MAG: glycosyltransferase family A protein [Planctomycetota bacterium]
MGDPLFTVIIPTFNRRELVVETLRSVFAQEPTIATAPGDADASEASAGGGVDYEVIVVDDGSTDSTLDVLRGYGDRLTLLEQQHGGCAAARNRGARAAQGRYLAFLDDDDLWFPWTLATFAAAAREQGEPAFIAGRLSVFHHEDELQRVEREPPRLHAAADLLAGSVEHGFFLGVAHGVVRRDAYLEVGGCEERNINATDSDVLLKMGDRPGFALVAAPATLAYRRHEGRTTTNMDKALAGVRLLLDHERAGRYPGGRARKRERMINILARARGVTAGALRWGFPGVAWRVYAATFAWSVRLGRLRYLAAVPAMLPLAWLRRPRS